MRRHPLLLAISVIGLSLQLQAGIEQAPPNFPFADAKAIFVDFTHSSHEITYDLNTRTVTVDSVIDFEATAEGYPLFDLVPGPSEVFLDEVPTTAELTTDPDSATVLRVLNQKITPGPHRLRLKHTIDKNVVFSDSGVASAFWLSDLSDRAYLEQYLPSNLEYDQHSRDFRVRLIGAEVLPHMVKTNGTVTELSDSEFTVSFPEFYTSSSIFFHLLPTSSKVETAQFYYSSVDGRLIPVDIYSLVDVQRFADHTKTLLAELEGDYGPFPHDKLVIYGTTLVKGGMEYAGATATGLLSLGHELFHSYNARGLMPANGNSGWMDEGMARWRDDGYPLRASLTHSSGKLSGHSIWRRSTDRDSYAQGSAFLGLVAHKMSKQGLNLKGFLRDWLQGRKYTTVTTQMFEADLAVASGMDFSDDFNRFIYGGGVRNKSFELMVGRDHHHPSYTEAELLKITAPERR